MIILCAPCETFVKVSPQVAWFDFEEYCGFTTVLQNALQSLREEKSVANVVVSLLESREAGVERGGDTLDMVPFFVKVVRKQGNDFVAGQGGGESPCVTMYPKRTPFSGVETRAERGSRPIG